MDKGLIKAFYQYIFVMFAIVLLLSVLAVKTCTGMRNKIITSHAFVHEPDSNPAEKEDAYLYGTYIISPEDILRQNETDDSQEKDLRVFTDRDKLLCHMLEILTVLLPFLFLCAGIWIAGSVFYARKLKKPFYLLHQGIAQIEKGDLDFSLEYPEQDELGNLCRAFETMRQRVLDNNSEMWNMVEERRKLNASVAHDLRTPITVIKGYSEYLIHNLKKDTVSLKNMDEISGMIGRNSYFSRSLINLYYGENDMEDSPTTLKQHEEFYDRDKITGAFARYYCDSISLGIMLLPVFVIAAVMEQDRHNKVRELIDTKPASGFKLVFMRYLSNISMMFVPVLLLPARSFFVLARYADTAGYDIDVFAFPKYIVGWILPTLLFVAALSLFLAVLAGS